MSPVAILGLLAITLGVAVVGLRGLLLGRQHRQVLTRRARPARVGDTVPAWRRRIDALVVRSGPGASVEDRLRRADIRGVLAGDAVMLSVAAAALVAVIASRVVVLGAALVLGAAVLAAANARLTLLVRRRAELFADQLPDIARIMSGAVGAGMAVANAVALTAREMQEPARTLLGHAVRQMEVGQSLAGAMEGLKELAPSREMAVLVSTLVIQQRTGGDVVTALQEMSVNLEQRRDLRREVDTTMAGVRYTAYAVMGLGVASLAMIESFESGSLRRMTSAPAGQLVLVLAAGFYLAGYAATRRLSRVDV